MIEIKGTFKEGKMFRCTESGRWAKVTVTKFRTMPTMIACALGDKDQYQAFECIDDYKTQTHAKEVALTWVTRG